MPEQKYLRALFGIGRRLGMQADDLRDLAATAYGKPSLRTLTDAEASNMIDGLKRSAGGKISNPFTHRRRQAMSQHGRRGIQRDSEELVNARELQMLGDVATLRGWSEGALQHFIDRQIHHEIRTIADLNKVLWPLKAMNRRDGLVGKYDEPVEQHAG